VVNGTGRPARYSVIARQERPKAAIDLNTSMSPPARLD
jgi:hypothetical protein